MNGIIKVASLYLASVKVAAKSIIVLVLALLVFIAVVLVSLPQQLFSSSDIPQVSLAIVYGDGDADDILSRNINSQLENIDVVKQAMITSYEDAQAKMAAGEVDVLIVLPDDLLHNLVYGKHSTITIESSDPVIGTAVYIVSDRLIESLALMQSYMLAFSDVAAEVQGLSLDQRQEAAENFGVVLIAEALGRMSSIEVADVVSPYLRQVLVLLMFFMVSIASFFVAVQAAKHSSQGYVRHLYARGVRFRHLLTSQLFLGATIAVVLGAILGIALNIYSIDVSIVVMLVASVILSCMLTVMYLMFCALSLKPQTAVTTTLLASLALMFFLLFIGGGFYPTAMMQSDLRLFNPVWLADQLSVWVLGGSPSVFTLLLFIAPFVACSTVYYFMWRRSL